MLGAVLLLRRGGEDEYEDYHDDYSCEDDSEPTAPPLLHQARFETRPDGATFTGDKFNGQRHGFGTYCFPAYDPRLSYEGGWKHNREHRQGALDDREGSRHEGDWAHGLRHGPGQATSARGEVTQGVLVSDKLHGRAKCVLANGCEAHGDFVCDKREGMWMLVSPPHSGAMTVMSLWQDNHFDKFAGAIPVPTTTQISSLLDATLVWADHLQAINGSYTAYQPTHM